MAGGLPPPPGLALVLGFPAWCPAVRADAAGTDVSIGLLRLARPLCPPPPGRWGHRIAPMWSAPLFPFSYLRAGNSPGTMHEGWKQPSAFVQHPVGCPPPRLPRLQRPAWAFFVRANFVEYSIGVSTKRISRMARFLMNRLMFWNNRWKKCKNNRNTKKNHI